MPGDGTITIHASREFVSEGSFDFMIELDREIPVILADSNQPVRTRPHEEPDIHLAGEVAIPLSGECSSSE